MIVEVDRHPVRSVEDVRGAVKKHPKEGPILFLVRRHGASLYLAVPA